MPDQCSLQVATLLCTNLGCRDLLQDVSSKNIWSYTINFDGTCTWSICYFQVRKVIQIYINFVFSDMADNEAKFNIISPKDWASDKIKVRAQNDPAMLINNYWSPPIQVSQGEWTHKK